ncbi:hypothetical protein AaE_003390 [Aphanomyces astaci]|uniref:AAA+ ATPase domain-containing protein n=1 Tax=Aphanomyces astaci TaxID=112090 RepID=A0A6A5ASA9_APHAT|nr:hypothetical protein AaE_003390 [Aphanomyces astaci]
MDTQAIQFGMMSSLRTNNVVIDTLVCMLIPVVFTALVNSSVHLTALVHALQRHFGPPVTPDVVRKIETKQAFNSWGKVHDNDQHNHILQKAISIYLSQHLDMQAKSGRYELLESAQVDDTEDDTDCSSDDSYDCYWNVPNENDQLKKLQVGALPPLNEWIQVDDALLFKHEESAADQGNDKLKAQVQQSTVTFYLSSKASDASERIDAFVERAYANYQALVLAKHKQDKARYLYMATSTEVTDDAAPLCKRYALGEDKTFNSLFFEEKDALLTLLNNFDLKRGKFGIPGFPYKLGLLLHGPPGTGKTSLIKAIAQHTKRHIVTISLSKIKTNQELMDMMCDLKFAVQGEDLPVKLGYEQVVFVMEDIDCASNVVHARTTSHDNKTTDIATNDIQALDDAALTKALAGMLKSSPTNSSKFEAKDKLNLSGLLNVLDGVVDSPGRILIMTTNHPEKLDPALVRPGRVNKKLLLGHMTPRQAQLMMEHYFSTTLDAKQRMAVDEAFATKATTVSPAQVEQLCAEYDDVSDMLVALMDL